MDVVVDEVSAPAEIINRDTDTLSLYEQAGIDPSKRTLATIAASGEYSTKEFAAAKADLANVPASADTSADAAIAPGAATTNAAGQVIPLGVKDHVNQWCGGTGTDGQRVQIMYVREAGSPDRYAQVKDVLLNEARYMDDAVAVSSAATGGGRRFRWVTDANCDISVANVVLQPVFVGGRTVGALSDTFDTTRTALQAAGWTALDRKYVVFADIPLGSLGPFVCGQGNTQMNPNPNVDNNDGRVWQMARIDRECWVTDSNYNSSSLHELLHTMGAVQRTAAPHGTEGGHCTDGSEVMCYLEGYRDQSGNAYRDNVCPAYEKYQLDCNHDDYFNLNPSPTSWLGQHPSSNIAYSPFLQDVTPLPTAPAITITPSAVNPSTNDVVTFTANVAPGTTVRWAVDVPECVPVNAATIGPTFSLQCFMTALPTVTASAFNDTISVGYARATASYLTQGPYPTLTFTKPASALAGQAFSVTADVNSYGAPWSFQWSIDRPEACTATSATNQATLTVICNDRIHETGGLAFFYVQAKRLQDGTDVADGAGVQITRLVSPTVSIFGQNRVDAGTEGDFNAVVSNATSPTYSWSSVKGWGVGSPSGTTYRVSPPDDLTQDATDILNLTVTSANGTTTTVEYQYTAVAHAKHNPEPHDTSVGFTTSGTYPTTMNVTLRDVQTGRAVRSKTVWLQQRGSDGQYQTVKNVLLSAAGSATFTFPVNAAATFRVAFPGDTTFNTAYSAERFVAAFTKATNAKVKGGLKVTLTTGAGQGIAKQKVTLQKKVVGTSRWVRVKVYTTSTSGAVTVKTNPPKKTDYRWLYGGSTNYRPLLSRPVRLT